jgi:hypothetical protein
MVSNFETSAPNLAKSIPKWAFKAKGLPVQKGLNGFERVLKICSIGEPQTELRVQSSVQPKFWIRLESSLLGFRFKPKFGTELWQH